MKNSNKSLISLSVLFIFAFSLITPTLLSHYQSDYNQGLSATFYQSPSSAANETATGPIPAKEIKEEQLNDLGQIEIYAFTVRESIRPANFIRDDLTHITYDHDVETVNPKFDSTIRPASAEYATGNAEARSGYVRILLNESVTWTYTEDTSSFSVGFEPLIQPATLYAMFVNGSKVTESNYSIEHDPVGNVNKFFFNFTSIFNLYPNGEFNIKYQYTIDIPISEWKVINQPIIPVENEYQNPFQYITAIKNNFTMPYVYNVTFGDESWEVNVSAKFRITFPNPEDIFDLELTQYSDWAIDEMPYSIENNTLSLEISTFLLQRESLSANFKANFTVEILESIDGNKFWCEDRLVSGTRNRERDYKITVSEGPSDLMVAMFGLNDTSIYFDDLNDNREDQISSALNRKVVIIDMNRSDGQSSGASISPNETVEYVDGISMLISGESYLTPYALFKDEVDIITVKYQATRDLNLVITDNTKTPISGIKVNIYFCGQRFGSKMSLFDNLPYPSKTSDDFGRISVYGVPIGDYSIEILDSNGNSLQNLTASSLQAENLIVTDIPHFPMTVIIFGAVSVSCIIVGIIIWKKRQ